MKNRKAFTLVEALVVLAIVCTLIALLIPAVARVFDHGSRAAAVVTGEPAVSWSLYTVQHDGHWFILGNRVGFHHPDCPCRKRQAEAD